MMERHFAIGETEISVDEIQVAKNFCDEPDSPFHHCYSADAVPCICLNTDENFPFWAYTVDDEWYFVEYK